MHIWLWVGLVLQVAESVQVNSLHALHGPTASCWQNTAQLDGAAYPSSTEGITPDTWADVCDPLTVNATATKPVIQLLQDAQKALPCGSVARPCTAAQLHVLTQALHAAVQSTLHYHVPGTARKPTFNELPPGLQILDLCARYHQAHDRTANSIPAVCKVLPALLQLTGSIAARGTTVDCRWDPTLPPAPGRIAPRRWMAAKPREVYQETVTVKQLVDAADTAASASPRYLVAFNLHQAEDIMPHFVLQLLALVTYLPRGKVLVSCYESGSEDSTADWVMLVSRLLDMIGVPSLLISKGDIARLEGEDRIAFLALVRNAALSPILDVTAYEKASSRLPPAARAWFPRSSTLAPGYPADIVVFPNDVYWNWQDVIRLTKHDAHLACGLDFDQLLPPEVTWDWRRRQLLDASGGKEQTDSSRQTPRQPWYRPRQVLSMPDTPRARTGRQLSAKAKAPVDDTPKYGFYDIWVARDISGYRLEKKGRVLRDSLSMQRLKQGLPFPVQCCWNGLAVMTAHVFRPMRRILSRSATQKPIFFRAANKDECPSSECSMLCDDMWMRGLNRLVIDPSVRITYEPYDRRSLHEQLWGGVPMLTWRQIKDSDQADMEQLWFEQEAPLARECCPLEPGEDMVIFPKCHMPDEPGPWIHHNNTY